MSMTRTASQKKMSSVHYSPTHVKFASETKSKISTRPSEMGNTSQLKGSEEVHLVQALKSLISNEREMEDIK